MKFEGKIIISDVDGTLTGSSEGIKKNIEAIKYFTANGGYFTLATGRMRHALGVVIPEIIPCINAPAILCNGAYVFDFSKEEYSNIHRTNTERVIPLLHDIHREFQNIEIRVNYRDKFLSPALNRTVAEELKDYFTAIAEVPIDDLPTDGLDKIVFFGQPEPIEQVREYILNKTDDYVLTKSFTFALELLDKSATKGNQVKYLKNLLGGVTTYCIGDYENDENMLASADYSACPASGLQKIKDMADIIAPDCKLGAVAGLVEYIEDHL